MKMAEYVVSRSMLTEGEMRKELSGHQWPHYVYALCVPYKDHGVVFYVGKGVGDRVFDHVRQARQGSGSKKSKIIRLFGDRIRFSVLAVCSDDRYASGLEAIIIRNNKDCLLNVANGSMSAIEKMFAPMTLLEQSLLLCDQTKRDLDRQMEECNRVLDRLSRITGASSRTKQPDEVAA